MGNQSDDQTGAQQNSRRLKAILYFFIVVGSLAFLTVLSYGIYVGSFASCMIWTLACLICGIGVGFLFGIPKILQNSKTGNGDKDGPDYQLHVNSNLTEISDWLTKIIVGLGLVKLTKIPPYLTSMAVSFSAGIVDKNRGVAMAVAYGTITGFSVLGFLFGYLFTRLHLSKAISLADQDSLKQVQGGLQVQINNIETKQGLLTHHLTQPEAVNPDWEGVAVGQDQGAVADISVIVKMADEYMAINIQDWAERTRAKDEKANDMGLYALSHRISSADLFDYIQAHLPIHEGLVMAMATLINIDPKPDDLLRLLQVGPKLSRLHVRYRVLLAIVSLQKKGYIGEADKQPVTNLVKLYRVKADDSLLRQIDYTLSFLNS